MHGCVVFVASAITISKTNIHKQDDMLSCNAIFSNLALLHGRHHNVGEGVCYTCRQVREGNPEELGVPACAVARSGITCWKSVLHAWRHFGKVAASQHLHGELLHFYIWRKRLKEMQTCHIVSFSTITSSLEPLLQNMVKNLLI